MSCSFHLGPIKGGLVTIGSSVYTCWRWGEDQMPFNKYKVNLICILISFVSTSYKCTII